MFMTWLVRALAALTCISAAVTTWSFATGAHAAFAWASWITIVLMLAASVTSLLHTHLTHQHISALSAMQRIALARFRYNGDYTEPVQMPPVCSSCGEKVTGYTGRYDSFKHSMLLTEANVPCGCIIHHVRFYGDVTETTP
jgi:hypothetical protein